MFAVDQVGTSQSEDYLSLFHRYIIRSIEALTARTGPDLHGLTNERREEAWHLLDYGLKLADGWLVVRKLLLSLAPRMERDGFRHEWLPYLERGVAASRQAQDTVAEGELSYYIGRLYRLRGDFNQARHWFEASEALSRRSGEQAQRAQALNQLAYVARLQNRFDLAEEYVNKALTLLDEKEAERATSYWVLGTLAQAQLNWSDAEKHHQTALQIWQQAGDQQRVAWSLQNLGDTLRAAGRYEEAIAYIQQAIVLLGELHDVLNLAIARMSLGVLHIFREEKAEALALFTLAEAVFRQVGDQFHLAMVYTNMTIVQRELGQLAAAEESGKRAIRLWDNLADPKMLANAEGELGLTYIALGEKEKAIAILEDGLARLATVPPDPFQQMIQKELLAHLEEARGEQEARGETPEA